MSPPSHLDVLLVIRACAEHYPPTVNQANILAEAGLRVGLVDLFDQQRTSAIAPGIHRWRVHRAWNSKTEPPPAFPRRWINWWRFKQVSQSAIRTATPRVVMAYDTLASIFVKPCSTRFRTMYHFHELPENGPAEGRGPKLARERTARFSRQADLVVFSDAMRAQIYQAQVGLRDPPRIVMNCPRRMAQVPASPLRWELAAAGCANARTVCYLGSIGTDQGVLPAARSMGFWPEDVVFVLVGNCSAEMRQMLIKAAAEVGTEKRVLFLGARPHGEALALVAGGQLGLSLIQPNTENWRYSAGAINKRFEYMALGLPQVSSDGPGVREIVEVNHCGFCVNPNDPSAIGQAVRQILETADQRQEFSVRARALHLERFNYECQFDQVLRWIRNAVGEKREDQRQQMEDGKKQTPDFGFRQ